MQPVVGCVVINNKNEVLMDTNKLKSSISKLWDDAVVPALSQFVAIPCKSPPFDTNWKINKYYDQAANLFIKWSQSLGIEGVTGEIIRIEGRTPLLYIEVPGDAKHTVLFYGHLDKMPETEGWEPDLGPWTPVLKNGKLYGRGTCDDGYAALAPLAAIKALREQNIPHAKCVIVMESTEECGSPDFPPYLEIIRKRVPNPELVICLDSDGEDFEHLWCTTSLRGIVSGTLRVEMLQKGVHSGLGSGVAASTFRIIRHLLSRIEDEKTGKILLPEFWAKIPADRVKEARETAKVLGAELYHSLGFTAGAKPMEDDLGELLLNQTWRPFLGIIGAEGLPSIKEAGNVLRPFTELQLSIRIPPLVNPVKLADKLKQVLEQDPPYNARVTFTIGQKAPGWDAKQFEPWLIKAIDGASKEFFGNNASYKGLGGSIGVIQMMNEAFPNAQFIITGAAGPGSNAHVPNECLDIAVAKKVTCCVADIMAKQLETK